jgi:hypothetical protein
VEAELIELEVVTSRAAAAATAMPSAAVRVDIADQALAAAAAAAPPVLGLEGEEALAVAAEAVDAAGRWLKGAEIRGVRHDIDFCQCNSQHSSSDPQHVAGNSPVHIRSIGCGAVPNEKSSSHSCGTAYKHHHL